LEKYLNMIKHLILASMVFAATGTMPVLAQGTAASQQEMPAIEEAPVAEATTGESQGGLMDGEKPFTLTVDENVGELIYEFDEETKELESIKAKRGVIFASEDMTLNSDEMEYRPLNSQLVATGKRVVVRMGEMIVTCQLFKYNPETQEGDFQGSPIVYQRDKEGKVTETAGRTISIVNVNGKFQMRVGGGGGTPTYVQSSGVQKTANGSLEKKTLAPGQKGATITLNNSPSTLATSPSAPTANSNDGGASSGGMFPTTMGTGSESSTAANNPTVDGNKIDPDNPTDVKNLTQKKPGSAQ
jgi:hypothetical protein